MNDFTPASQKLLRKQIKWNKKKKKIDVIKVSWYAFIN